jgi:hypothetical protein
MVSFSSFQMIKNETLMGLYRVGTRGAPALEKGVRPSQVDLPADGGDAVEVVAVDLIAMQHTIPVGLHQAAVALPLP